MRFDKEGCVDFVQVPIKETKELIRRMETAQSIESFQQATRCFRWLYETMLSKQGAWSSDSGVLFYDIDAKEYIYIA